MPRKYMPTMELRPTKPTLSSFTLTGNAWIRAHIFTDQTSVWAILNTSVLQAIRYAYSKGEPDFGEVQVLERVAFQTIPAELWLQRSNAASNPVVKVEIWEW